MSSPQCRFCQAEEAKQSIKGEFVYGGKENQHFWECADCEMIYLYPVMSENEEDQFYHSDFEKFMSNRAGQDMDWTGPEKHIESNQREVQRRMPFLEKYIRSGMKVLEVGCSSGFMLYPLKEKGLDVYGLEPSGGFSEFVRSKGVNVFETIDQIKQSGVKFDLIIHYYVFEHVRKPEEFLSEYMGLLSDSGKMIFEVPCATDPLVELYDIDAFDKFYWSVVHHWYFNKASLGRVLEKVGLNYELFPEQRYDISNHMVWMQDGKPGGLAKYSHIFGPELDQAYKDRLKEHWLCDTLIAVIQK